MSPTDSTTPDISCPITNGAFLPLSGFEELVWIHRGPYCHSSISVAHNDVYLTFTNTSFDFGSGFSISSNLMSLFP